MSCMSNSDSEFDVDRELADIDALLQNYKACIGEEQRKEILKFLIIFWALVLLAWAWKNHREISGGHLLLACYLPAAADIVMQEISLQFP